MRLLLVLCVPFISLLVDAKKETSDIQNKVVYTDYDVHHHNYAEREAEVENVASESHRESSRTQQEPKVISLNDDIQRQKRGTKKFRHHIRMIANTRQTARKRKSLNSTRQKKHIHLPSDTNRSNNKNTVHTYEETHEHIVEPLPQQQKSWQPLHSNDKYESHIEQQLAQETHQNDDFIDADESEHNYQSEKHEEQPEQHEKIKVKHLHHHHHHHHNHVKEIIKKINVPVEKIVEKIVHVPKPYPVEKLVEKKVPYPVEKIVEKIVNVPIEKVVYVPKPYPVEKIVEKKIPYPVEKIVEKIVHIPKPYPVEKIVEKIVHIPKPYPVIKPVPFPVEKKVAVPYKVEVEKRVPVFIHANEPYKYEHPNLQQHHHLNFNQHKPNRHEEQAEDNSKHFKVEEEYDNHKDHKFDVHHHHHHHELPADHHNANLYQQQTQATQAKPSISLQNSAIHAELLQQKVKNFGYLKNAANNFNIEPSGSESKLQPIATYNVVSTATPFHLGKQSEIINSPTSKATFHQTITNASGDLQAQPSTNKLQMLTSLQPIPFPFHLIQLQPMPFQQAMLPTNVQQNVNH